MMSEIMSETNDVWNPTLPPMQPRPSAARQLQLHRAVESSGQELGAEEEASPKVAPRHAVRQISLTATAAGACAQTT